MSRERLKEVFWIILPFTTSIGLIRVRLLMKNTSPGDSGPTRRLGKREKSWSSSECGTRFVLFPFSETFAVYTFRAFDKDQLSEKDTWQSHGIAHPTERSHGHSVSAIALENV